jgi:hypothetical protein
MNRGDVAVRNVCVRGPVWSWWHELLDYECAAAYRRTLLCGCSHSVILRRSPQAVRLQVHAKRVNQLG